MVVLPSETVEPVTRITRPVVVPGALRPGSRAGSGRPRRWPVRPPWGRAARSRAAAGVARNPGQDRQAVAAAKLLFATQAGVERLGGEGGANPEDEAGEDALRRCSGLAVARPGLEGRSERESTAIVGSGPLPSVWSRASSRPQGSGSGCLRGVPGDLLSQQRRGRTTRSCSRWVRSATACLAKASASCSASFGESACGGDGDDVALGDRLGADLREQRLRRLAAAVAFCDALGNVDVGNELRCGLDGRVGSLESVIRPRVARVGSALETGVISRVDVLRTSWSR